jgi:hypothetical protein
MDIRRIEAKQEVVEDRQAQIEAQERKWEHELQLKNWNKSMLNVWQRSGQSSRLKRLNRTF